MRLVDRIALEVWQRCTGRLAIAEEHGTGTGTSLIFHLRFGRSRVRKASFPPFRYCVFVSLRWIYKQPVVGKVQKNFLSHTYPSILELLGPQNEANMCVKCKLCVGNKSLKCAWSTSSNLRKHIMRVHPTKVSEMEQLQKSKKRKLEELDSLEDKKKQPVLSFTTNTVTQHTVDNLIVNFVCNSVQPFSIVEEDSFVNLIKGRAPTKTVISRKTLSLRIKERYENLRKRLIAELHKLNAVCITADCWSHFSKSYLGVTINWIDADTLERKSAMLTVERLKGRHTFDVLAAAIERVHQDFNVQNKVVSCVTDNGSNFVKAFTMFGIKSEEKEVEDAETDVSFVEITPILDEGSSAVEFSLPQHQRCAAHLLNLIATKDSQKAEEDAIFKKIARSSFALCQALWNKQRSTIAADSVHEKFQKLLVTPNATRWNSMYNSVKCLVSVVETSGSAELDALMDSLGLQRFRPSQLTFLKEYIVVMKPVAVALNILQAEKNKYIGYLLPTIKCLLRDLNKKASDSSLNYCRPLAKALVEGTENRFGATMKDRQLIIAAGLIPALKCSWLDGDEREEAIALLKQEVLSRYEMAEMVGSACTRESAELSDEENFFSTCVAAEPSPLLDEVLSYLSSTSKSINLMLQYKSLLSMFFSFNCGIPSSAPVERLFSQAKDVLSPKRSRLSDTNFKMQLFCKVNAKVLDQ